MFLPRPSLEQAHVKYVPFPKALFSWLLIFRRFEKRTKAHWAGAGEVWCGAKCWDIIVLLQTNNHNWIILSQCHSESSLLKLWTTRSWEWGHTLYLVMVTPLFNQIDLNSFSVCFGNL